MKKINQNKIVTTSVASFVFVVLGLVGPTTAFAATAPSIGTLSPYAIVSSTYTNSNTAPQTIINGDRCDTTPPGTAPLTTTGTITTGGCAAQTGTDQLAALNNVTDGLNVQSCTSLGTNVTLSGTYTPGCYSASGSMDITASATITLNGAGVYIFKAGGALTTGANSSIALTNGASASNVFWAPVGATSLGAYTTGGIPPVSPTFVGNILDAAGITLGHFAYLSGRALAFGGVVITDANTITVPSVSTSATLYVIKNVVNNKGGTAVASAWTLTLSSSNGGTGTGFAVGAGSPGTAYTLLAGKQYSVAESGGPSGYTASASSECTIANAVVDTTYTCTITDTDVAATLHVIKLVVNAKGGTAVASGFSMRVISATSTLDVAGSPQAGAGGLGTSYTLSAGTYSVNETGVTPYTYTQSFTGDCNSSGSVTLALGADKTCTLVNTDVPPPGVAATGGGSGYFAPVIVPLIGILKVPSPLTLPLGAGPVTYNYTVWNVGGQQTLTSVTVTDDKCSDIKLLSGDSNSNGKLDAGENWKYACTSTLATTTTNTAIATAHSDDASNQTAIATAVATVVVGAPGLPVVPPPLINIVKVPSRLTSFPFGGGPVTYSYTVTNPGVVPMHDVSVLDDKCAPVSGPFGDTDGNNLLDPSETWAYACTTNISVSTRNIATAEGKANGLTAISYAFATVLVSDVVPGLPNTGFPLDKQRDYQLIIVALSIILGAPLVYVIIKNRTSKSSR